MTTKPDVRDIIYYGDEITKTQSKEHSIALLQMLDEGHLGPLQLAVQIKYMEDVFLYIKEELRQRVIAEKDKYGKDEMTYKGVLFEVKESGVKYDYSKCEDFIWNEINEQIHTLTEQRKEREAFLKTLKERFTYIDQSTGEIITLYPPQRKSTTTYFQTWMNK